MLLNQEKGLYDTYELCLIFIGTIRYLNDDIYYIFEVFIFDKYMLIIVVNFLCHHHDHRSAVGWPSHQPAAEDF